MKKILSHYDSNCQQNVNENEFYAIGPSDEKLWLTEPSSMRHSMRLSINIPKPHEEVHCESGYRGHHKTYFLDEWIQDGFTFHLFENKQDDR